MKKHLVFIPVLVLFLCSTYKVEAIIMTNDIQKDTAVYYSVATSGLNYRDAPRGKVLGKFKALTKVKVIEKTGVLDTITKGEYYKIIGEWVGVKTKNRAKKVYVFSGFLDKEKTLNPLDVFSVYGHYYEEKKKIDFVVLSDSYPFHKAGAIIREEYLGDNEIKQHTVTKEYRKMFLFRMGVKETDTVFIYRKNTILKYKVKSLPLVATPNPYGSRKIVTEQDYLIGFNLTSKINTLVDGLSFYATIGEKSGALKPIIWEKIDASFFPTEVLEGKEVRKFMNNDFIETFRFTNNEYTYFLKVNRHQDRHRQLYYVVVRFNTKIVFNKILGVGGEGTFPAGLSFKDDKKNQTLKQWTGKIVENKPPVVFGFTNESFGCSEMFFLDKKTKSIYVKCDNRH